MTVLSNRSIRADIGLHDIRPAGGPLTVSARPRAVLLLLCLSAILMQACGPDPGPSDTGGDVGDVGDTGDASDVGDSGTDGDASSDADADAGPVIVPGPLRINEVMSANEGAWLDDLLEADDWVELVNIGDAALNLSDFMISDSSDSPHSLPEMVIEAGARLVFAADGEEDQGDTHLPFKISSGGETLYLWDDADQLIDLVDVPALEDNEVFARFPDGDGAFESCRWPSPGAQNADECTARPATFPVDDVEFEDYTWPDEVPPTAFPLRISEIALRPASFVEVENLSESTILLSDYELRVAAHHPDQPWPTGSDGVALAWEQTTVPPGGFATATVTANTLAGAGVGSEYEAVVTLYLAPGGDEVDRVDVIHWPADTTLALIEFGDGHRFRFCEESTKLADNDCTEVLSRPIGRYLRNLYTEGDFDALAAGGTLVGQSAIKGVTDRDNRFATYFLRDEDFALHYTFAREEIYNEPHLDRCIPAEDAAFYQGWVEYSRQEYFCGYASVPADYECLDSERRFLHTNLVRHSANGLSTLEYVTGDRLSSSMMRAGFFHAVWRTHNPTAWTLRVLDDIQIAKARQVEGLLPIVGPNAPFVGLTFQALNPGVAYGNLIFASADEFDFVPLGIQTILVTDLVPNDIPLVGGLITEAFQTPLSHVNVLSRNRGTPNMALRDARLDPEIAPLLGELVRLEVRGGGFDIELADSEEAAEWFRDQLAGRPVLTPRLNAQTRGVQALSAHGFASIPQIGAKAAQLAELYEIAWSNHSCFEGGGQIGADLPVGAFAVPFAHYLDHFEASGAAALFAELQGDAEFASNPLYRARKLEDLRDLILDAPVDADFLQALMAHIESTHGDTDLRFRSSSNTEDLDGFNGAGLYESTGVSLDETGEDIADALRTVWASLWSSRAYDERSFFNVDQNQVAMAVLVHPSYPSEEANGVGISRNILDPIRGDKYYFNIQAGDASVVNPAPGVTTDQLTWNWGRSPRITRYGESSLVDAAAMSDAEVCGVAYALRDIHRHFAPLINGDDSDAYFAMDIEFKLVDGSRRLAIKQARPYSVGTQPVGDCREF